MQNIQNTDHIFVFYFVPILFFTNPNGVFILLFSYDVSLTILKFFFIYQSFSTSFLTSSHNFSIRILDYKDNKKEELHDNQLKIRNKYATRIPLSLGDLLNMWP
jgi:hypothetical protein